MISHIIGLLDVPKIGKVALLNTHGNLLSKYLQGTPLSMKVLEVGLQLVKDAYNQHGHGCIWKYWFSLPAGYTITPLNDARPGEAEKISTALQHGLHLT